MIKTNFVARTIHGWGCVQTLSAEVQRFAAQKVLLFADPFLLKTDLLQQIQDLLTADGIACVLETRMQAEPPLALAEQLLADARAHEVDLVLGVGGGSALDLAKLVAALYHQTGQVADYLNLSGTRQPECASLPKIMIPTTSGTGSEVTDIAVLSLSNSKDVVVHETLLADTVLLDAQLTTTMPPAVTAATGIDALTHAIESYVSRLANPISEALSLQAIRLIAQALPLAYREGNNQTARSQMSYGSYLAGLAFFNAGCAAVHALAYPLGGQFHLAHGDSNAVLLPYVMGYIRHSCCSRLRDIYQAMGYDATGKSEQETADLCIQALQNLVAEVGIATNLQAFGIPETALGDLTAAACQQKRLLSRTPMDLTEHDIDTIYQAAFAGKPFV